MSEQEQLVTRSSHRPDDALAPVRNALLTSARGRVERIRAEAEAEAAARIEEARAEAAAALADARAQGEADASLIAEAARARARRRARETELRAYGDAHQELHRRVRAGLQRMRDDPCYPRLLGRLAELARARLGAEAEVIEHSGGGLVAEAPRAYVDCSLDALAERAVAALGEEVKRLWAS